MSINLAEAQEIEEFGVVATDDNSDPLFYFTGGVGSPVGTAVSCPTIYLRSDIRELWESIGPGPSDWRKIEPGGHYSHWCIDQLRLIPAGQQMIVDKLEIKTDGVLDIQGEVIIR